MSLKSMSISRSISRVVVLSFLLITLFAISFLSQDGRSQQFGTRDIDIDGYGGRGAQILLSSSRFKKPPIERLDLSEQECRIAFPNLTKDIDGAVARGEFKLEKSNPDYQGLVQGRIKDGKLYILTAAPHLTPFIHIQTLATLHSLHCALITNPASHPLPATTFAFTINDSPKNNSWAFSRPNKASSSNIWLMPHFGFWAWPPHGTLDDALSRIAGVEVETSWESKKDQAIWRGTPWFNPLGHPHLRQNLLKAAKGRPWADVQALNSSVHGTSTNAVAIDEFCRFKYVVYTEGVTYSGRLMYHQACESVLLMAEMTWLTNTAWLVRGISAEELIKAIEGDQRPAFNGPPPQKQKYKHGPPSLLASVPSADWKTANAIYVAPDFSNLEQTILFLRKHPDVARRIARNQRDMVVGGGYLSTAAETCYWRALFRGWASSAVVDQREWGADLGERFESWILKENVVGGGPRGPGARV